MTELRLEGGQRQDAGRRLVPPGRVRVYAALFLVTALCGAAYLAGIWTGMRTHVTCTSTAPGQIVCSDGLPASPAAPAQPEPSSV